MWFLIPAVMTAFALPGLKLHDLRLEYHRFHQSAREPLFQANGLALKEAVNLGMDFELAPGVHWDHMVLSMTDPGQYRSVAWDFRIYVMPTKNIEIGYRHVSRHLLDMPGAHRFPVQDSLEFRWHIYQSDRPRSTWF